MNQSLRHGRFTMPVNKPSLLRFYLEELLVPHSLRELILAPFARLLPGLARTVLPKAPAASWEEQEAISSQLRRAGSLSRICLGDYASSSRGKTISFLFEEGGRRPFAIAKATCVPDQQALLAHEQEALGILQRLLPPVLGASVPRPLGERHCGSVAQFMETFAEGSFLYRDLRGGLRPRRLARRHFRLAGDWLLAFQRATASGEAVLDEGWIAEHILRPFETFERRCAMSPAVATLACTLADKARALTGERLPLVARHGDYWARNILIEGDQVRVIDWEGFEAARPPFHDWCHFALSYGLSFPWRLGRWEEPVAAFRSTFAERSVLRAVIREELIRAAKGLGVSADVAFLFLPVTIVERALAAPDDRRWRLLLEAWAHDHALLGDLQRG